MKKHSKTTLVLLATTLSACTPAVIQQPNLVADDEESVTCKKEAPIDSHVKIFKCRPVNKVDVMSDSPAIAGEPRQEVPAQEVLVLVPEASAVAGRLPAPIRQ